MDPVEPLIVDLLADLAPGPQPTRELLAAWRTSCPRLPVWEEAEARGLVERHRVGSRELVGLTSAGRDWLDHSRPSARRRVVSPR